MIFDEGDIVQITSPGLMLLASEAPEDFKNLQEANKTDGKLLHIEDEIASVEFTPDLVIAVPFESLAKSDKPETPEKSIRVIQDSDGLTSFTASGEEMSDYMSNTMSRAIDTNKSLSQANMAFSLVSIFASIRHGKNSPADYDDREQWQRAADEGRDLSDSESHLYEKALSRLSAFLSSDPNPVDGDKVSPSVID
jgi:hypothetical protein